MTARSTLSGDYFPYLKSTSEKRGCKLDLRRFLEIADLGDFKGKVVIGRWPVGWLMTDHMGFGGSDNVRFLVIGPCFYVSAYRVRVGGDL